VWNLKHQSASRQDLNIAAVSSLSMLFSTSSSSVHAEIAVVSASFSVLFIVENETTQWIPPKGIAMRL
jgi:hypothetical protein